MVSYGLLPPQTHFHLPLFADVVGRPQSQGAAIMTTNREVDQEQITKAHWIEDNAVKEATHPVNLEESTQRQKQFEILNLFGTIDFDPDYEPTANSTK
jgi:hypothetical protein